MPWRVASQHTVPWWAASGVARFPLLRLERLVRPDAVDAIFFFPNATSSTAWGISVTIYICSKTFPEWHLLFALDRPTAGGML